MKIGLALPKVIAALSLVLALTSGTARAAEDWKGQPYPYELGFSAMGGLGILDGVAGFGTQAAISKKIFHRGWLDDVNQQVHFELAGGPLFVSGSTAFQYSLHLRWDFHKNEYWSLYAIGGFGGAVTGISLGDRREFYPRFGIGAFWNVFERLGFRAELSHEFTGVGAVLYL